jgi:hypothetical protein
MMSENTKDEKKIRIVGHGHLGNKESIPKLTRKDDYLFSNMEIDEKVKFCCNVSAGIIALFLTFIYFVLLPATLIRFLLTH